MKLRADKKKQVGEILWVRKQGWLTSSNPHIFISTILKSLGVSPERSSGEELEDKSTFGGFFQRGEVVPRSQDLKICINSFEPVDFLLNEGIEGLG